MQQREMMANMHRNGYSVDAITQAVAPLISRRTVYRIIKKVQEGVPLQAGVSTGRKRSIRTGKLVEAVRSRIRRKSRRNLSKMSTEMKTSRRTLSRILHEDLHLLSYKTPERDALTMRQMTARVGKAKKLKSLVGSRNLKKIIFTDEKIFTLQETGSHPQVKFYSKQGQRLQQASKNHRSKYLHSPGVMVWGGVAKFGRSPLIFVDPGAKVNAIYYQTVILEKLKQWCISSHHSMDNITLQQDWAPAHRAKSTKAWLRANKMDFLDEHVYPAASPDLNPMDYSIWGWMQQKLRETNLSSVDDLKAKLVEIWDSLDQSSIDLAIDQLPDRLDRLLYVNGARFE